MSSWRRRAADIYTTGLRALVSVHHRHIRFGGYRRGVAAFMKAVDPTLSNGTIVGRLAHSADAAGTAGDPDNVAKFGNGRVNMAKALAETTGVSIQPAGVAPASPAASVSRYLAATNAVTAWAHWAGTTGPHTIANGTFSCGAGSNRLLVAVVTAESTAGAWSVTATKGAGVNFTTAVENPNSATHGVWIGYLTESQINGNTNSISIARNGGNAWSGSDVYLACYSGITRPNPSYPVASWKMPQTLLPPVGASAMLPR